MATWSFFTLTQVMYFTNWYRRQPNNVPRDSNCLEMRKDGMWDDIDCSRLRPSICEYTGGFHELIDWWRSSLTFISRDLPPITCPYDERYSTTNKLQVTKRLSLGTFAIQFLFSLRLPDDRRQRNFRQIRSQDFRGHPRFHAAARPFLLRQVAESRLQHHFLR